MVRRCPSAIPPPLLDYATLNARNCARLQTDYEGPLELSLMGGEMFT